MTHQAPIHPDRIRQLDFSTGQLLGKSNQGEVRRFHVDGRDLAIKMPKGRGLAWKVRQATLKREFLAYQRLIGIPGLAHCHGLVDETWLVLEHVEGQPFRDFEFTDRETFFSLLLDTIQAMHDRGVAHGDLKRKDNLLVTRDERPVILDLGAATLTGHRLRPLNTALFRFMRQTDLNAWVKLKHGSYQAVSMADRHYLKRSWLERALTRMRGR
jgi:serine/threonine protein kinase